MVNEVADIVYRYLGKPDKTRGHKAKFKCPFHKDGNERRPSFGVDLNLGIFNCFTCHEHGNLEELLRLLGVKEFLIVEELKYVKDHIKDNITHHNLIIKSGQASTDKYEAKVKLDNSIVSRYLQWKPESLIQSGFSDDWLRYLEIGVDVVNERITYPIRDMYGNLAGISGGSLNKDQFPKYKVYCGQYRDLNSGKLVSSDFGEWFDEQYPSYGIFQNHNYLWNFHRVYPLFRYQKPGNEYLVLTEGFKACTWLLQNGLWSTVALMGTAVTSLQEEQLLRLSCPIVMFLDNDTAGMRSSIKYGKQLQSKGKYVMIAKYPKIFDGKQPDNLNGVELVSALQNSTTILDFEKRVKNEL